MEQTIKAFCRVNCFTAGIGKRSNLQASDACRLVRSGVRILLSAIMKIKHHSKMNPLRDNKVLGAHWKQTYNGYFGNRKNSALFVAKILPFLPKKKQLDILYPASASGLVGESLVKKLKQKGVDSKLTLVDISKKHLKENKNSKTRKILQDITDLELDKKFDVILMRSSLDYFSSEKLQIRVLRNIRKHLKEEGVFFNQAASMPSLTERKLADKIYASNKKIGRRHFQCKADVKKLYIKSGFKKFKKIGNAPILLVTEKEHAKRYGFNSQQIVKIKELVAKVPEKKRPKIQTTKEGYKISFVFPIYAAWRK